MVYVAPLTDSAQPAMLHVSGAACLTATPQIAVMHCRIHKHTTFRQWCMWMEPQVCIFFCWSTVQDVVYNCCFNFGLQIYYRLLGATQPTEIMSTDQHETGLLKHTTPQLNVKLEIVLKLFNGVRVSLHCLGFACAALYAATAAGLCSRV